MNLEAAKAVKYGGVPRPEALKFVTLNAAIQLDLGEKIGSLEPGKDADFVIWNGDPLSTYTRCDETWIEGRRYFSREEDAQLRQRDTQRRELLISRVLATKHGQAKTPSPDSPDSSSAERGAPRPRADTVEREDRGTIRSRKKSNQDKAVEVSKPDAQSSTLEEKNDSPKGGTR